MNILRPLTIRDSMLVSAYPLTEDSTPVWVSGTSYIVGQEVHRVSTHRVYRCAVDTSGTTPPESAVLVWVDVRPTNRWAPFDYYTSTEALGSPEVSYRFNTGGNVINAVYLRGFSDGTAFIRIYDDTNTIVYTDTKETVAPYGGWYEYLFNAPVLLNYVLFDNLFVQYNWTIEVIMMGARLGLLVLGDMVPVGNNVAGSGVESGSTSEPVTYSFIKTEEDGTTIIRRRHSATNLRLSATVPVEEADGVVSLLQSVLDVPVAVVADNNNTQLQGLSTFGLVSGSVTYDHTTANVSLNVKGLV